jgi:hypothetical protein
MKIDNIDKFFKEVPGGVTTFSDLHQLYTSLKLNDMVGELTRFTKVTVASEEVQNKSDYDFPSLEDAFQWLMNTSNGPNSVILMELEDGTHYLKSPMTISNFGYNDLAPYYLMGAILLISGRSSSIFCVDLKL